MTSIQDTQPFNDNTGSGDNGATLLTTKRRRIRWLATAGAIVVVAAGFFLLTRSGPAVGEGNIPQAITPAVSPAGATPQGSDARASLELPQGALAKNPVHTVAAKLARLAGDIQVVGNVSYDADHFAIVGPLVAGRMTRLSVGVGGQVRRGQVVAEIESADVGEARGAFLSARARLGAAEANMRRERELADKHISSAREREVAEAQWASEEAGTRAAREKLLAIGLTEADIRAIGDKALGGRVGIRAPIDGTVIERLVTLGEAVEPAADAFKIADLSHVWILLDVYEKDLARVKVGQHVEARTEAYPGEVFPGRVAYVTPVIDEATRTAKVRVEMKNEGKLHIGQLVNARLVGNSDLMTAPVLTVPRGAIQRVDGKALVFVKNVRGYERRPIELGISGGDLVEVRTGLNEGEEIATDGAFLLKSEMLR